MELQEFKKLIKKQYFRAKGNFMETANFLTYDADSFSVQYEKDDRLWCYSPRNAWWGYGKSLAAAIDDAAEKQRRFPYPTRG